MTSFEFGIELYRFLSLAFAEHHTDPHFTFFRTKTKLSNNENREEEAEDVVVRLPVIIDYLTRTLRLTRQTYKRPTEPEKKDEEEHESRRRGDDRHHISHDESEISSMSEKFVT